MPNTRYNLLHLGLLSLSITACSSVHHPGGEPLRGIDDQACIGQIQSPQGMTTVIDSSLLHQAQAATDQGGLCAGRVFVVQQKVRVYRVWDSGKSYTRLGRWWSLSKPVGPKENYQHDYAICPAWSALNRLVSCDVKVGSSIVIGTTQSAACDDSIYAKTAANQVFIPNDTRNDQLWVENCRDEGTWPNQ